MNPELLKHKALKDIAILENATVLICTITSNLEQDQAAVSQNSLPTPSSPVKS